jgi:tetratricopeptide (TPR) repeat protein
MEVLWIKGYYDYLLGRWEESLAEFLTIREQAEKAGGTAIVAGSDWGTGYLYTDRGEYDLARKAFQAYSDWGMKRNPAYKNYYSTEQFFFISYVDLKQGRVDAASARLKEIELFLPKVEASEQEAMTLLYHLLEAEVFLAENLPEKAIDAGLKIVPANFPNMTATQMPGYNIPFLKDVLARAYWKIGDLDKAIAEYVRLTTIDPKTQIRYLIHPLYHYRLGRVYEEKGEKAKATAEYQKFLEYWKDADATHPELADARKRLVSL